MRRITYWALSTLTVLVLLFSYSTSRNNTIASTVEARSTGGTSQTTTTTSPSPTDLPTTSGTTDSSTSSTTDSQSSTGTSTESSTGTSTGTSTESSTGTSATTTDSSAAQTYLGDEVNTRWGIVQVQITVQDGKITASEVTQVPWANGKDQQINSRAVPVYNEEAVSTQSADIDVVSGATVTWQGYTQSLQSAIDQANL